MQAQQGVLKPPKQHTLIQIYNFDSLPLIVMNVARIGAQIPGMASELKSEYKDKDEIHTRENAPPDLYSFVNALPEGLRNLISSKSL